VIASSYTVSASATWEKKIITVPGDTTGAINNDTNSSLVLRWWLAAGSNFTSGTLQTSWAASLPANTAVGQTNLAAATSNYWQITGVQLEVGPVATPFEFKPFGQELAECQRYYFRNDVGAFGSGFFQGTTTAYGQFSFPQEMRAAPTSFDASTYAARTSAGTVLNGSSIAFERTSRLSTAVFFTVAGATNGQGNTLITTGSGFIGASAEL
jgi:hypothetical protein